MHSTTDAGFLPLLIGLAKEKGVRRLPRRRREPVAGRAQPATSPPCSAWRWRRVPPAEPGTRIEDEGIPFREIAEAIGSRLGLPAVSIPADVLMLPGYFGFLANLVTLDLPASNAITRQTLGWEPTQPGLLADLDNGHYFPAS